MNTLASTCGRHPLKRAKRSDQKSRIFGMCWNASPLSTEVLTCWF